MAISCQDCSEQAGVQEVAERTLRCLKRTVPAAVPGIVFLSGGQSDALATEHLNAMNKLPGTLPWKLSFSYGRPLQAPPLKAWSGKRENLKKGQQAFLRRAKDNAAAPSRPEEQPSGLPSLMRTQYAAVCLNNKKQHT